MNYLSLQVSTSLLLIPTLLVGCFVYGIYKLTTRISPNVPYAGEESFSARLSVPLEYGKDPAEFLCKTRKKLGDVFCVDLLILKIVFFLGPEGNKIVLRADEDRLSFLEHIKWATAPAVGEKYWRDPEWNRINFKFIKFVLQNQERLRVYLDNCIKITDEHFEKWLAKGTVPLFESFSHLVLSYLLVILVGEGFYKKYGAELVPMMVQYERDLQKPILRAVPGILWAYTEPGKALERSARRFDELIDRELRDIMMNSEKHKGRDDYFYYITSQVGDKHAFVYGRHIQSLVFGGHANAAMTVPWILLHARRTPGALERMREEAGLPRDARTPYLEACLRETGRLYTSTTMMRMTKTVTTVAGHTLPPRTHVACSPAASQREDSIYENAMHWNPDRFLSDPNAYAKWFQNAEFVQFGLGAHACPGEKLARLMIFDLMLKDLLEKLDIDVVSGLEEGMKGIDGVGAEAAWSEENFGTPYIRGKDVMISVKRREVAKP